MAERARIDGTQLPGFPESTSVGLYLLGKAEATPPAPEEENRPLSQKQGGGGWFQSIVCAVPWWGVACPELSLRSFQGTQEH